MTVCILYSLIIPLPHSPLVTINFFLCLWLYFCFVNKFICTIFKIPHVISHDIYLSLSDTIHLISFSRFIHVVEKWHDLILFYGLVVFHCIYIKRLLYAFLCWWTFKLLLWLHDLAVVNSAAVSIRVPVSFWIRDVVFLDILPGMGLLDHRVTFFFIGV